MLVNLYLPSFVLLWAIMSYVIYNISYFYNNVNTIFVKLVIIYDLYIKSIVALPLEANPVFVIYSDAIPNCSRYTNRHTQ